MEEVPTPKPQSGEVPARFRADGVCYYSAEQSGKAKGPLSLAFSGVTRDRRDSCLYLPEGPRMMTNVVTDDPSKVKIGDALQARFDDVTPEITLPEFNPA